MYNLFKRIFLAIVPKTVVRKLEPKFRQLLYLLYKGNIYRCNICNAELKKFIYSNKNLICARCGSIGRDRRLYELLNSFELNNKKILDFSPSRCLYRTFKNKFGNNYTSTDLSGDFIAEKNYDITNITVEDNSFDIIICFHVLEHIVDDNKAISELFRVLKPKGNLFIQTPINNELVEDLSITQPKERLKNFGQEDHVRIYNLKTLENRLKKNGFITNVLKFENEKYNSFGFDELEYIIQCTK